MNTVGDFCSDTTTLACSKLIDFLTKNFEWINDQIEQNPNDPYWHHVNLIFAQFYGLYHGYYNLTIDLKNGPNVFKSMIADIKPYLNLLFVNTNFKLEIFKKFFFKEHFNLMVILVNYLLLFPKYLTHSWPALALL